MAQGEKFPIRLFPKTQNFVKFIATHPCADPFPILVETFFPAFVKFAFTLYFMTPEDMAMLRFQEYERPPKRGGKSRGTGHNRKQRTVRGDLSRVKVIGESFTQQTYTQRMTQTLAYFFGPIERIGLKFLIYNAVEDLYYDWQTMLEARDYCSGNPNSGPIQLQGGTQNQLWGTTGFPISAPTVVQNRSGWPWSPFAIAVPVGQYYGWVAVTVRSIGVLLPNCFLRVRIQPTAGFPKVVEGARSDIPVDGTVDIMVYFDFDYPFSLSTSVDWEACADVLLLGQSIVSSVRVFCGGGPPNGAR